jgi:NO-binding membrane sensor protein with MHYT domain
MEAGQVLRMEWNGLFVFLSFIVAVFGSWCSLVMIEQAVFSTWIKKKPVSWIALGGLALGGCGIWTMHFVGMSALNLGIPFSFRIDLVIVCNNVTVCLSG